MSERIPTYSVVVPTKDNEETLERTVDSILAQTLSDLEIIIIENASTDGTRPLTESLGSRHDRVRTIVDGPVGPGPARNAGIEIARGEWIAFLDADDTWNPNFLEHMTAVARKHPGHALYACNGTIAYRRLNASVTWGLRHKFPHTLDAATMAWMSVLPGQVLLRTDAVRAVGGYEHRRGEETDLWFRIMLRYSGYWVPIKLYHNHQPSTGISRQPGARERVGISLGDSITSHLDEVPDPASRTRLMRRAERWYAFSSAAYHREELESRMARGEYSGARGRYLQVRAAYQSTWRYVMGLPVMMLSPRLFARMTGSGHGSST